MDHPDFADSKFAGPPEQACFGERKAISAEKLVSLILQKDPSDTVVAQIENGFDVTLEAAVRSTLG